MDDDCPQFTKNEVLDTILCLGKNKACGVDNIYAEHLLYAAGSVAQPMCDLFNSCLAHECVPDTFALSVICPVLKEGLV